MKIELGTLFAAAALCGIPLAQSTPQARIPRPLAATDDVKTQAPVFAKAPAAPEAAHAQVPAPATPAAEAPPRVGLSSRVPTDRVHWSSPQDEQLWALGATYKCGFLPEGATYVPYFGPRAPRNYPLELRVAEVSRGGVPIAFRAEADPLRDGERVSWDRGSFVEVYDLEPSSIEQSFVFERLPGEGELLIRIAACGDLAPSEKPEGLEFGNDLGTVRYGRATVIDAAGKSAPAPTRHGPGAIEIRVPQEFLADAAFPLVVDPVVSSFWVSLTPDEDYSPDVAFDATTGTMFTVFESAFSASDHDILAFANDALGFPVGSGFLVIDNSSDDWQNPEVANLNASGEFLVVAQAGPAGARDIVGELVIASSMLQSATFTISPPGGGDKMNPTVGGDPSPTGPSYFCVAWERVFSPTDHDIHARLVDPNGTVLGQNPIFVDNTSSTLDQNPSISKSNGMPPSATQDWTIVWQRRYAPGDDDLYGAQLHWDGAMTEMTFQIDGTSTNTLHPRVSSITDWGNDFRRYLVAWQRDVNGTFLISMALRTGATSLATADLEFLQNEISPIDKSLPAVDTDGSSFALVYNEVLPGDMGDVYLANVCVSGPSLALSERKVQLAHTAYSEMRPRLVSDHGSGGTGGGYSVVWDRDDGFDYDIEGARYEAPVGGPVHGFCAGFAGCPCGNNGSGSSGCANSANFWGATLVAAGSASVSQDSLVLSGSGMLPHSTVIYLQGTTSASMALFGDGLRCVGGSLIRLKTTQNSGGASSFPVAGDPSISVRGQVPRFGATRTYQAWYRDTANFCNPEGYNITNGITAAWTP